MASVWLDSRWCGVTGAQVLGESVVLDCGESEVAEVLNRAGPLGFSEEAGRGLGGTVVFWETSPWGKGGN